MSQEQDYDGSDNAAGQQRRYYDNALNQSRMQSQVVPQQPLHMQLMQSHQQHNLHLTQQQQQQQQQQNHPQQRPQSLLLDETNPSIVYDRTIKVPKTDYADHGSHGVAALPLPGVGHGARAASGSNVGGGAPAPPSGGLPSSVQMQLQMQQMAAARSMLQQQQQQYRMMPPPPNGSGGGYYHSLVSGSMGRLQGPVGTGPTPAAAQPVMNTTSSVGLMQAFNAQMAANQQAQAQAAATMSNLSSAPDALANESNRNFVDQQQHQQQQRQHHGNDNLANNNLVLPTAGDVINANTLSSISNLGQGGVADAAITGGGGTVATAAANNPDMILPGEIRNGKKRTSPSVPLHPSQLQLHHGGGGIGGMLAPPTTGYMNAGGIPVVSSNLGMNSVVEEEESLSNATFDNGVGAVVAQDALQQQLLQAQQVLNPSMLNVVNQIPPQGLLGSALNEQSVRHHQGNSSLLPPSQQLEPQQQKIQKEKAQKPSTSAPSNNSPEKGHGEVLTNPSIPSANSGLDNAEGNLIVRRGDILRIPRKNMHSHPPPASSVETRETGSPTKGNGSGKDFLEFRVVNLLGQGTFAQVFHCVDIKSEKSLAVKIVKNKPAYTRQAAVEIDVFRKLNAVADDDAEASENNAEGDGSSGGDATTNAAGGANSADAEKSKGCSASASVSTFSSFDSSTAQASSAFNNNGENAIIRLMSYFMYSSHLCLVFEMLGPNLYELLKKRQFRGLPMGAVRTLIRQATEGIKLLGRRNVVHCDLKPENILMVRSEDLEGVIAECKSKGEEQINAVGASWEKTTAISAASRLADPNTPSTLDRDVEEQWIKLIDFGSACFEGQTTHTYIQSRFYRSPEVLIGLPYDSAIDIWSLGCVAAELFLGLPILPGVHEHDQLGRILEMIGPVPDWMLEQGSKSSKFFKNVVPGGRSGAKEQQFGPSERVSSLRSAWEFKTRQEYINFLTEEERRSKGGLSKLEQQQTNRYFKKKRLEDIVMHHGVCNTKKERDQLGLFVHFLKGVLDPDPWKRWTSHQASMHPFLTGSSVYRIKSSVSETSRMAEGEAKPYDIHWVPPWDASISRRKLMVIQKAKEKAAAAQVQAVSRSSRRLSLENTGSRNIISQSVPETSAAVPSTNIMQHPHLSSQVLDIYGSPLRTKKTEIQSPAEMSVTSQMAAMADAMSLERARSSNISGKGASPPQTLVNGGGGVGGHGHHQIMYDPRYPPAVLSASLGGVGLPLSYQQLTDAGAAAGQSSNIPGRSFSDTIHPDHISAAAQHQHLHTSLTGLNDVAFLQPPPPLPPPPALMGAQSYSGAYGYQGMPGSHYPYVESELGYALQRPGVVPGMGSDAFVGALRRQSSTSNAAMSAHQQQQNMLSANLSNLSSSTPQNYGVSAVASAGGSMNYQSAMSPGGLLLQKLGLQEQMLGTSSHYNTGGGGAGATSLLAQQLEEYSSQPDHQQGGQRHQQLVQQVHNPSNPLMGRQHSFTNNSGSYRGGAPPAVPVSLTTLPYMQSASFSDFGDSNSSARLQQQHNLAAQMHRMSAMQHYNGGSSSGHQHNVSEDVPANQGTHHRPAMG